LEPPRRRITHVPTSGIAAPIKLSILRSESLEIHMSNIDATSASVADKHGNPEAAAMQLVTHN
jgi:hypothetical protein